MTAALISDSVLDRMEADGWTPEQVRRLIRSYRETVDRVAVLEGSECQHCGIAERLQKRLFDLERDASALLANGSPELASLVRKVVRGTRSAVLFPKERS